MNKLLGKNKDGYELADEIFTNIGRDKTHTISIEDTVRVISFWGFGGASGKPGFVQECASNGFKRIVEKGLVFNDYKEFDKLLEKINEYRLLEVEE